MFTRLHVSKTKKAASPKVKTAATALRLREELMPALDVHADELGISRAKLLEQIVETWLVKHPVDDLQKKRFNERAEQRTEKMEKMGLPASRGALRSPRKSHFAARRSQRRAAV